jgi:transposase
MPWDSDTMTCRFCGAVCEGSTVSLDRAGWDWFTDQYLKRQEICPKCHATHAADWAALITAAQKATQGGMPIPAYRTRDDLLAENKKLRRENERLRSELQKRDAR